MGVGRAVGRDLASSHQGCVSFGWARRSLVVLHEKGTVCSSTGTLGSAQVVAGRPGDRPFVLRLASVGNPRAMAPPFPVWPNGRISDRLPARHRSEGCYSQCMDSVDGTDRT